MQLYRAIAHVTGYCSKHAGLSSEVVVFFECRYGEQHPGSRLVMLLSTLWRVPVSDIEHYNLVPEQELIKTWCTGPDSHGDCRLLEVGFGPDGICYADPTRTLFLLSPANLERLTKAQREAEQMQRDRLTGLDVTRLFRPASAPQGDRHVR